MDDQPAAGMPSVDSYSLHYGQFADRVYAAIRREAFGADIGQQSWLPIEEHQRFIAQLDVDAQSRVLEVASGSGGPSLRLVEVTGCQLVGIEINELGVATANDLARSRGLADRAQFVQHDASTPLPFPGASFDAVLCIDAINHLADRPAVLTDWHRVLKPGGRLLFTDPITVTGPLSNREIAHRSSIGFFLFVPPGEDERLLRAAGFQVESVEDSTENMARVAGQWHAARERRAADLRQLEGEAGFADQQAFFAACEAMARERRLSRFVFLAHKP